MLKCCHTFSGPPKGSNEQPHGDHYMQNKEKGVDYFVELSEEEGGENTTGSSLQPEEEAQITQGLSNLLQLKRPRLTWEEEEINDDVHESSSLKKLKGESKSMEWENGEVLLEESCFMAEEASLSTPPPSQ